MKKVMIVVSPLVSACLFAATGYLILKNKRNMMDVLIEEIETIK